MLVLRSKEWRKDRDFMAVVLGLREVKTVPLYTLVTGEMV